MKQKQKKITKMASKELEKLQAFMQLKQVGLTLVEHVEIITSGDFGTVDKNTRSNQYLCLRDTFKAFIFHANKLEKLRSPKNRVKS